MKKLSRYLRCLSIIVILAIGCGEEIRSDESNPAELDHTQSQIVGGQNESGWPGVGALTGRVPGYGYIGSFCTGALITSDWVLTAAHCLLESGEQGFSPTTNNVRFYVGTNANPTNNGGEPSGSFYSVDRFIVHPNYNAQDLTDDIALMHLSQPANGVETYDYNEYNLNQYVGNSAFYVGYGANNGRTQGGSGVKRSTNLTIGQVDTLQYVSQYSGSGTCFGDSGGPGLLNIQGQWRIIGVNSAVAGNVPCEEFYISTRVDSYAPWISQTLGAPLPNCNQQSGICLCDNACQANGSCDNAQCQVLSCSETYECLIDCGQNQGCQTQCYAESSAEGQSALDALLSCFNNRCGQQQGEAFQQCASQQCSSELGRCFPRETGGSTCEQISDCVYDCPANDTQCQETCLGQGTGMAQDMFFSLNTCFSERCGTLDGDAFYECVAGQCNNEYFACYPPDDCRVTGGSCGANQACYVGFGGRTYCYPSQGVSLGSACDQSSNDVLICADGAVCVEQICTAMCEENIDCSNGGSCLGPIFDSNAQVGICDCTDEDGDGVCADVDCDDQNPALTMIGDERCGDGLDNNCNGMIDEGCEDCVDQDGDGFCNGVSDCADQDPNINSGALEQCGDNVDNNCNNSIDEGCENCIDNDGDGFCANINDCVDQDPNISPVSPEVCGDGIDNNCDQFIDLDCVEVNGGGPSIVGDNDGEAMIVTERSNGFSCASGQTRHPTLPVLLFFIIGLAIRLKMISTGVLGKFLA
jgi:V8-like Glu-specific endopeptidase